MSARDDVVDTIENRAVSLNRADIIDTPRNCITISYFTVAGYLRTSFEFDGIFDFKVVETVGSKNSIIGLLLILFFIFIFIIFVDIVRNPNLII